MQRVAFMLKLRPGAAEEYDEAHRHVWPEMIALLHRAGISEFSIFRRDELLILCMRVDNFDKAWSEIEQDPVNTRWQASMAPYLEPPSDLRPGERFAMLQEVFFLPYAADLTRSSNASA